MKNIKRGDMINVSTMTQLELVNVATVVGRYVGTTKEKVIWVAYREEDFEIMCQAFDSRPR